MLLKEHAEMTLAPQSNYLPSTAVCNSLLTFFNWSINIVII